MELNLPRYNDHDAAYRFLVCSLVRSQMELKREQDEGVNVYLAHLLTSLGIFQNLGKPRGAFRRFYEQTPAIYMGRGKAYYDLSAEYHRKIYRQRTTLEEILHKLAFYFEEYVRILAYMRSSYFDFVQRISGEDFERLLRRLKVTGSGNI